MEIHLAEIKREDDYERQDSGIEVDDTKGTPLKYGKYLYDDEDDDV